jgi:outer membrane protein assembly factor BamB
MKTRSLAQATMVAILFSTAFAPFAHPQTVTARPTTASPTAIASISGTGFRAHEAVDIYFDAADLALAVTNVDGAFSSIQIRLPARAVPGLHWITCVGRFSGIAAQTPFTVQTNWPMFHHDLQRKGYDSVENVLSASNVAGMDLLWKFTTGNMVSSPAVVNGVVYVGSDDFNVYALNASTGSKLWQFATGGAVESSPAVANGIVYVGSDDNYVHALNASTGAKLWQFATPGPVISSPAVANGVVYVGSYDNNGGGPEGHVYALNASTGAKLWQFTTHDWVTSSPAVANGVVYVASWDKNIYALNAGNGFKLWQFSTGALAQSSPAVANGVVYVGSGDNNVYALNASTGAELWQFTTGGSILTGFHLSSPAVAEGVVYVGSYDGNVYAFGLPAGMAATAPGRPDPKTLIPNLGLQVSQPAASLPAAAEE